jgi:hypothetical protein
MSRTITIRPRRVPLTGASLRLLQEIEALEHGHALGGEFRERRVASNKG